MYYYYLIIIIIIIIRFAIKFDHINVLFCFVIILIQ